MFTGVLDPAARAAESAKALAQLMERELGTNVEPEKLRLFLVDNWTSVSTLAHLIHNGERVTSAAASSRHAYAAQQKP